MSAIGRRSGCVSRGDGQPFSPAGTSDIVIELASIEAEDESEERLAAGPSRRCRTVEAPRDPPAQLAAEAGLAEPDAAAGPRGGLEATDIAPAHGRGHPPQPGRLDHCRERRPGPLLPPNGRRAAPPAEVARGTPRPELAIVRRPRSAGAALLRGRDLEPEEAARVDGGSRIIRIRFRGDGRG